MSVEKIYNCNTIEEVVNLLDQYKDESKLIAGGTDLVITLNNEKITPKALIDISKIEELRKIEEIDDKIVIGAGVTFTQLMNYLYCRGNLMGLFEGCRQIGSPQIRNKGTIGGNIGHGSPAADTMPPLIALGTSLNIMSKDKIRNVLLEDFSENKEGSGLGADEMIVSLEFKMPLENEILTFSKLGLRNALAISRITTSALIGLDHEDRVTNIKLASGSIGKYPMREIEVEKYLLGKVLNETSIDKAVEVIRDSMDQRLKGRGTLPYKRVAVESILKETLSNRLKVLSGVTL